MARQTGEIIIEGTIDDITFYRMEGKGHARSKSCLKGERAKRDPRFKRTMQSARRLARGSQLASKVYRSLPRPEQVYGLFQELKHIAILALKEGKAVMAPPRLPGKTREKKTPRPFRIYGGRTKEAGRRKVNGRRQAYQSSAGKRFQQQRE